MVMADMVYLDESQTQNVVWAMPTLHIELEQKGFKLLVQLPAVRRPNAQHLPQSFAKCAVGDRDKPPEMFIY